MQKIHARVPIRIDLAGGTLDLWPLYLMVDQPYTVNLGIDLYAEATVAYEPAPDGQGKITLSSVDQKTEASFNWTDLFKKPVEPSLILHQKILQFFLEFYHLETEQMSGLHLQITTQAQSPAGAGLGGSSALSVAICGAVYSLVREIVDPSEEEMDDSYLKLEETEKNDIIQICRDIESQILNGPAGLQDYYGAAYGGLQTICWGPLDHHRMSLGKELLPLIEERILLFYSGKSRNSGINNWEVYKNFIDQKGSTRSDLNSIGQAASDLDRALLGEDWEECGKVIQKEWHARTQLASGIATDEIHEAWNRAKEIYSDIAMKVCGAGGGGCFFFFLPQPDAQVKTDIIQKVTEISGVQHLPFSAVANGLELSLRQ